MVKLSLQKKNEICYRICSDRKLDTLSLSLSQDKKNKNKTMEATEDNDFERLSERFFFFEFFNKNIFDEKIFCNETK